MSEKITDKPIEKESGKIKTREGSGYLKQLYSTARVTAGSTHSHLKNLTTFLVNFVPIEKVDASELQVRAHFDDTEVASLAHSIKEHGVLQPILVVQDGDRYKVIAGERRLRASKLAGMERIPARVLSTDDKATHEIALRENLDRVDLHPIEEGEGYVSLLEAGSYTSHESIAKSFGKPKSRITECIGFTKLPEETKTELMKRGLKNRALLRQLLQIDASKHLMAMDRVEGKEEILGDGSKLLELMDTTNAAITKTEEPSQTPAFTFSYLVGEKKVMVPAFKWKKKDGPEVLDQYVEKLKEIVDLLQKRPK